MSACPKCGGFMQYFKDKHKCRDCGFVAQTYHKPETEELKTLFPKSSQCAPCIKGYPECNGNKEDAKRWQCKSFYSGFFIVTQRK